MTIQKRIKCVQCGDIVENTGNCSCGKIKIVDGVVKEGSVTDYVDVSLKMLNE